MDLTPAQLEWMKKNITHRQALQTTWTVDLDNDGDIEYDQIGSVNTDDPEDGFYHDDEYISNDQRDLESYIKKKA